MNTKHLDSMDCTIDLDSQCNIWAELQGVFDLNASGDADDEKLENLLEFKEKADVIVSSDFDVVGIDEDNSSGLSVGDTVKVSSDELGSEIDFEDENITLTIRESNGYCKDINFKELVERLEVEIKLQEEQELGR